MDFLQILFYIAIGLIYLVIQGVNKAKEKAKQQPASGETLPNADATPPTNATPPKTGPVTLQDLLNDFGEASRRAKQQAEIQKVKGKKKLTEKAAKERQKDAAPIRQKLDRAKSQTDEQAPFSYEREASDEEANLPRYENQAGQVDYEDPKRNQYAGLDDHQKRFAAFDLRADSPSAYADLINNPQGARNAFILSEIFKRKYE